MPIGQHLVLLALSCLLGHGLLLSLRLAALVRNGQKSLCCHLSHAHREQPASYLEDHYSSANNDCTVQGLVC